MAPWPRCTGKLKGAITAAGPRGSCRTRAGCGPSPTTTSRRYFSPSANVRSNFATTAAISSRDSRSGFPVSREISAARDSAARDNFSRQPERISRRSSSEREAQSGNAATERATHAETFADATCGNMIDRSPGEKFCHARGSFSMPSDSPRSRETSSSGLSTFYSG